MKTRALPFETFVLQIDPTWKIEYEKLTSEEQTSLILTLLIRFNLRTTRDVCNIVGIRLRGIGLNIDGWFFSRQTAKLSNDEVRIEYTRDYRDIEYLQDQLNEEERKLLIEEY